MPDSKNILYSAGKNDECYTMDYAIYPIIEFLDKNKTYWLPFDTENSRFYQILTGLGFNAIRSHISEEGKDFYSYEPDNWDCIISNPPFTNKRLIFERALSFNKPFALIMSNTWLNDAAPTKIFKEKDLQLLMFSDRMHFKNSEGKDMGRPTFASSYFCYNFLPKQIVIRDLKENL